MNCMDRISREAQLNPELLQISRRLTGLSMKRPGLAFGVHGEPGIGKTYATLTLLRGVPYQSISVHTTLSLENILQRIPRPKKITLWLEKILERLKNNESLETGILNQALIALLAANAPIILQVEDLHEASFERLEFFKQLALGVTRVQGVGLIVTSRIQPPEGFEAIRLSALNREESDTLLEAEASAKLPREALAWLFERATGNPLFTLEFFRLLARQGSLWNDGQSWRFRTPEHGTLPSTVEALIEHMLQESSLTPTLQAVLAAKAMLGLNLDESAWRQVAGLNLGDWMEARTILQSRGVLANDEFSHPLYREVVEHGIPIEQRRMFARKAISVFKDDPASVTKFVDDAELEPFAALELLERTALRVKKLGNEALAGQLLAKAVKYQVGNEQGKLALEAAILLKQSDEKTSLQLSKLACETLNDATEAVFTYASTLAMRGNLIDAEKALLQLSADKHSTTWLEELIAIKAVARDARGVVELWNQHPETRDQFSTSTRIRVSSSLMRFGKVEEALSMAFSILTRQDISPLERDELHYLLGCCYHFLDQAEKAVNLFQSCIRFLRSEHKPQRLINVLNACSGALIETNQHQEALLCLNEALEVAAMLGNPLSYACTQYVLADLLMVFGEFVKAEELLLESRTLLLTVNLSGALIDCETFLSNLYQISAFPFSALLAEKYALCALKNAYLYGYPHYINVALRCLAASENCNGRPKKGLVLAEQILSNVNPERLWDLRENYLVYGQSLAALGQTGEAITAFQKAETAAKQIGELYKVHLIGLEIDRLHDNLESAKVRLQWFQENGLMSGFNIVYRYFPKLKTESHQTSTTSSSESMPLLEVLGSMQITLESQPTPVRGRKRQELLALLLEARISGRGEVSKLELNDKLYPDADELQSNAGIRDVIYQIRSSLGENAITTTANGYALGSLKSDVETFLETGNTRLWRGMYLEGLLLETSDTIRESLYLALRTRAEALLETDPLEVTRLGRLLCEADPYDLEALRLTVMGLRSQQNHRSLSRFYDQARTRFLEIGETLPETWQEFLSPVTSG